MTDMAVRRGVGPVKLSLAPDPTLSRVLRLAASGMASEAGFSLDELEDIRIAVSEVLIALIEHGDGAEVCVTLSVDVGDRGFLICGATDVGSFDLDHPDLALCRTVLEQVSTSHEVGVVDGRVHIRTLIIPNTTMSNTTTSNTMR